MRNLHRKKPPAAQLKWLEDLIDHLLRTLAQIIGSLLPGHGDPLTFDGARHFGQFAIVVAAALLLSVPALGCWPAVGAAVALYYLLVFFNALEQRDLDDAAKQQAKRTNQRAK